MIKSKEICDRCGSTQTQYDKFIGVCKYCREVSAAKRYHPDYLFENESGVYKYTDK